MAAARGGGGRGGDRAKHWGWVSEAGESKRGFGCSRENESGLKSFLNVFLTRLFAACRTVRVLSGTFYTSFTGGNLCTVNTSCLAITPFSAHF